MTSVRIRVLHQRGIWLSILVSQVILRIRRSLYTCLNAGQRFTILTLDPYPCALLAPSLSTMVQRGNYFQIINPNLEPQGSSPFKSSPRTQREPQRRQSNSNAAVPSYQPNLSHLVSLYRWSLVFQWYSKTLARPGKPCPYPCDNQKR